MSGWAGKKDIVPWAEMNDILMNPLAAGSVIIVAVKGRW